MDIVVTHAAPKGLGDAEDRAHWGFETFLALMEKYRPRYLLHGHVHMNYGQKMVRQRSFGDTQIINAYERYVLEIPDVEVPPRKLGRLIRYTREPKKENR